MGEEREDGSDVNQTHAGDILDLLTSSLQHMHPARKWKWKQDTGDIMVSLPI